MPIPPLRQSRAFVVQIGFLQRGHMQVSLFPLFPTIFESLFISSNPQPPSKNDIELKEKRVDAEKDVQSGGNRHKGA